MLKPNLKLTHEALTGRDVYGAETFAAKRTEGCCIVKLKEISQKTSVRTDASATRGYADEFASSSRLLVLPSTQVQIGDRISIVGVTLRVTSKFPRHDVEGRLDHYEVEGSPWV